MATGSTTTRKQRRVRKQSADSPVVGLRPPRRLDFYWPAKRWGRLTMLGILAAALLLRVHNLLGMFPIEVDESIYLRWAEIIDHQRQWLISLLDGKPPLHAWFLAIARMIFGGDPLLSGRLVSVAAGILSTLGMFAIGRRMGGEPAGLIAAGLYAVFPLAVLYDRLAYTESLVNLFGIAIVLTSLDAFSALGVIWGPARVAALVFFLGLFTKQTVLLFAFFPVLAGIWLAHSFPGSLYPRLGLIYGAGVLSLVLGWLLTPAAPMLGTHSAVLHHTGFYVQPAEFLKNPFTAASRNIALLGGYINSYMTLALALCSAASLAYLTVKRDWGAWVLASVSILPLLAQVLILSLMFPSRWAFPHFWPWLVIVGLAAERLWWDRGESVASPSHRRAVAVAVLLLIFAPVSLRSLAMLASPQTRLHADDASGFLGSSAHVGFGIQQAVEYLEAEAVNHGPFVLLVDPIWGPPADAIVAYLHQRHGIQAHEAWWTQLSGTHPIMPGGSADLLRSHYERVQAGKIDFRALSRVFYVTDTNYYTDAGVKVRQPDARLIASYPKPDGKNAIHIYRLK